MKLSRRLWLLGAALPVVVLAAVLGIADRLYHLSLEQALDQALLSQAAVESVSLFDGPNNEPHLHMATSPLTESVRPFAPEGTLFGPEGEEVTRYPPPKVAGVKERLLPKAGVHLPEFETREVDGEPRRELVVTVSAPGGGLHALRLSASMAQLDRSVSAFHQVAIGTTLLSALVLVAVQLAQGRRLRARLRELQEHLEQVKRGQLDQVLPPETEGDEIADLRLVLAGATKELQHAHAAWERLLADAAHELRTPLTLMRTSLDLALRRERSAEELKEALRDARQEVDRLAVLATRLLDTVSVGKGEHAPSELAALTKEAIAAAKAEAESRGVVIRLSAPQTAQASVDAGGVRQAIDNLLSNAIHFAPVGSEVTVTLEQKGGGWTLSVADGGPGIPPAEREAVFEPFHRATGERRGAGLGLTIVREVARQHGGRAYVADSPRGTTVVIELSPSGVEGRGTG
ncbi:MAG: HAMP domain-containing sensor histidine kinase [Archangium sp.]|nr:HAMP domain-containing sensor histidine kinase [Archangium sp.]